MVETAAHLRAAQHLCPEATFVLDIGGQDMKALWVRDGQVADAVLNEACSSGCGAFVEGTSYSLRSNPWQFAERVASMGEHVVVQGGTFKSDAVLRAFEKVSGREVVRFEQSHLMGAIGAALIGAERARSSGQTESTLIGREALDAFSTKRRSVACGECPNACALSVVEFGDGRAFVTGNKCAKGANAYTRAGVGNGVSAEKQRAERPAPNVVAFESALLATFGDVAQTGTRGKVRVGLMNTLEAYAYTPFWHTPLVDLGLSVLVPDQGCEQSCESAAWETLPSESVCYPAKTTHVRAFNMRSKGAHAMLMPRFARNAHCPVPCSYVNALIDNLPPEFPQVVAPLLANYRPEHFTEDPASRAELSSLGFAVLGVTDVANEARRIRRLLRETQPTPQEKYSWKPAKRLVGAALWVAQNAQVDLACIQSFGCGFDAVPVEDVRATLEQAYRPFTTLKIDDIVDTAHIRIRLRTLAEAIESRKRHEKAGAEARSGAEGETEGKAEAGDFDAAVKSKGKGERAISTPLSRVRGSKRFRRRC